MQKAETTPKYLFLRLLRTVEKIQMVFCCVAVAALTIIILFQVFARLITGQPFLWGQEISCGLCIWLAFNGSAVMVRRHQHVAVVALYDKLPKSAKALAALFNHAIMLFFTVSLLVASTGLYKKQLPIAMGALQVSRAYYFAVPVFIFAFTSTLYIIGRLIEKPITTLGDREVLIEKEW
jgi:TRAP-type C4-dicarboxylate transport system permease small subunit